MDLSNQNVQDTVSTDTGIDTVADNPSEESKQLTDTSTGSVADKPSDEATPLTVPTATVIVADKPSDESTPLTVLTDIGTCTVPTATVIIADKPSDESTPPTVPTDTDTGTGTVPTDSGIVADKPSDESTLPTVLTGTGTVLTDTGIGVQAATGTCMPTDHSRDSKPASEDPVAPTKTGNTSSPNSVLNMNYASERKYKCLKCTSKFFSKDSLEIHLVTHSKSFFQKFLVLVGEEEVVQKLEKEERAKAPVEGKKNYKKNMTREQNEHEVLTV